MKHRTIFPLFLLALLSSLIGTFPSNGGANVFPAKGNTGKTITVTLALASRDEAGAYRAAAAFSDPGSSSYRSPMPGMEWIRRYGPDPRAVRRLIAELSRRGLRPKPWNGGTLLQVEGTETSLTAMFDASREGLMRRVREVRRQSAPNSAV